MIFQMKYLIPINSLFQRVQKYKRSNYDDSIFDTKNDGLYSIISYYSKIPPIIYESAGIDRPDDYRDSEDTFNLKKKSGAL
jgi:hypothetical protein